MLSAFVFAPNALAIPSPDVVLGLFASTAQALGLLSVVAGGWLWRRRKSGNAAQDNKAWRIAALASTGLLLLTLMGWGLYAAHEADVRARRLQVNLERSSKEDGKKVGDVSLKELPFSEQLLRKDGISSDDLARDLANGSPLPILDVREGEEFEMGMIHGARHARFPDVLAKPEQFLERSRQTLLLCYNGNRSSEMVTALAERGYDCRFMIGGYEKWLTEERPLDMAESRSPKDLRQVPEYANRDVLLDTPDVLALIEKGEVLFVDVRYPGEFDGLGHLPGAVNLPFRKLTSPDLQSALDALPRKPVIVACYDKRSSFYGLVTGLRLVRNGFTYLGRYTTPETFPSLSKDKPHVAAWKKRNEERTLLSLASAPISAWMGTFAGKLESLALAILLAAIALRVVLLPLTLRADRDRIVQQGLRPELERIERENAGAPAERSRATMQLLRQRGIRPTLGLLAGVLQLVLFSLFFAAVASAAKDHAEKFLWLEDISGPDGTRVLPLACGVLAGVIALLGAARLRRARWAIALGFGALVSVLLWESSAAVGLYLSASLGFVLAQGLIVRWWISVRPQRALERRRERAQASRIVPLALAELAGDCGNKAARLSRLANEGFDVPPGFVVRPACVRERLERGAWSAGDRAEIERALAQLRATRVAVRSSGANEDGGERSFAGVFESVLDVEPARIFEALDQVVQSFSSERARSYSGAYSGTEEQPASILVQAMVPAEYAGVLFTEHPEQTGVALVELVAGLGDALVSGRAQPQTWRVGRVSGRQLDSGACALPLRELHGIGRRIEALFGGVQDIEWAWVDGRFHVLQARDVTRAAVAGEDGHALRERERRRVLEVATALLQGRAGTIDANAATLVQDELSQLLPEPTPASLSLLNAIAARGGSTDLACGELGLHYVTERGGLPVVVGVFGRTYSLDGERARRLSGKISLLASFRLGRMGAEIERGFREDFLPEHTRRVRLEEALDLARLELSELVALQAEIAGRFLAHSYRKAEVINLAADFYVRSAVRACEKHGLDPASQLAHLPSNVVHEALELLARVGRGEAELGEFLELFGHRAAHDYELSEARYREVPDQVLALIGPAHATHAASTQAPDPGREVLRLALGQARRYQALKEEAKHAALRDLASLRRVLLAIGARIGAGEGIFQLEIEELAAIGTANFDVARALATIAARQEQAEAVHDVPLPSNLTLAELEELDVERSEALVEGYHDVALSGTRVAGRGDVIARARVLHSSDEIDSFLPGEILVARYTDPSWMPVFPRARGLVMEVGGWLSHAAIQAREYELTCIVGVTGALGAVRTGDLLFLRQDGGVERLAERRGELRSATERLVGLRRGTEELGARLVDVSVHGALVLLDGGSLRISEHVTLIDRATGRSFDASVARNGTPGYYGLRFEEALSGFEAN